MASYPPKKNAAFTISLPILDADGDPVAGAATLTSTIAGADGVALLPAFAAGPTPVDEGEGFYSIELTAGQMNFDRVAGVLKTATAGAKNTPFTIYTSVAQIDDLVRSTTPANTLDVSATGEAGLDWANIGSPTTAQNLSATNIDVDQVVASVSGAVGSVTGATTVGTINANVINAASIAAAALNGKGDWNIGKTGYALSAAGIQAIWDALTSALTVVGSIGKLLVDNINATISSRSSHSAADIWASVTRTLTAATNITSTGGTTVPQTGDNFARLGAPAGASIAADIATRATPAQVNTEVVDAINVDTYAEPGQATPAATTTLAAKINYLYKAWRNRTTQTSTTYSLYNDDATTVAQKSTVSDDGTTFDRGEVGTGP